VAISGTFSIVRTGRNRLFRYLITPSRSFIFFTCLVLHPSFSPAVMAQSATTSSPTQTKSTQDQTGTTNSFSYSTSTTLGVSASQNTTPNYVVESKASIGVLNGSQINNTVGSGSGSSGSGTSAAMTPNSLSVTGLASSASILLDTAKTSFSVVVGPNGSYDGPEMNGVSNGSSSGFMKTDVQSSSSNAGFASTFIQSY
jgi:hypothetical protein